MGLESHALALVMLALVVGGGVVALDAAATDVDTAGLSGDEANVSDALDDFSQTGSDGLRVLMWPAVVGLVLAGLALFARL